MKSSRCFAFFWLGLFFLCASLSPAIAQYDDHSWDLAVLDRILAAVPPGQTLAQVGDMQIQTSLLRLWRNQLAGGPMPNLAFDGGAPHWTGGNVYYEFSNGIPAGHQKVFVDGVTEWATFANVHFIPHAAESNYVLVIENPLLQGGHSAVGMVGGQQLLQFGPSAWNRGTIVHEMGHSLGLVHEHQRSDRDSYVTILSNNIMPGNEGDFIVLTNSDNHGPYDFLSVMHYARNAQSVNTSLDTIEPLPAYSQFINIMGGGDPVLTPSDRAGMAAVYGPGPTLTSVVTNTQDSGPGSLRAALYYGYDHPGTTITFNIPTNDPGFAGNVFTIRVTDQLPSLWNATIVDGTTEPFQLNTNGPAIQLNGALTATASTFAHGFHFRGTNCGVRGLVINGFPGDGILMDGNALSNFVSGCYLGIDPTGAFAAANGIVPVNITGNASGNRIGGTNAAARNVISGSTFQGITIRDGSASNNVVQGNFIGLNATGTAALANGYAGVEIVAGPQGNVVGGVVSNAANVISGNTFQGVAIHGAGTDNNVIAGNLIGLNAAGNAPVPNGYAGVELFGGTQGDVVGGTTAGARNTISGNTSQGVTIDGSNTVNNTIAGNYVGLDRSGAVSIANGLAGIEFTGAARNNTIGGVTSSARNIVSGNARQGIAFDGVGTSSNLIAGNYIGLDSSGSTAIPNGWSGINFFGGSSANVVGGNSAAASNIISGNANQGVVIQDPGTDNNLVEGNYIGTAPSGSAALPNQWAGVEISNGPRGNTIGGNSPGAGNVVSGNNSQGIYLNGSNTANNLVQGNLVGLNAAGTAALANSWSGVEILNAQSNVIGGGVGTRNFISGNGNYGVLLDTSASANVIQGNTIGLDAANLGAVPNAFDGIGADSGAQSNQIGGVTPGAANLIAGNSLRGVAVFSAATNISIRGNSVYGNSGGVISLFGGNHSQPAPSLGVPLVSSNFTVIGTLSGSASNTVFHLDFYASPGSPATVQARTYVGAFDVTTGVGGSVNFSNHLPVIVPAGYYLAATATDPAGNTSGLSAGAVVQYSADSVGDGIPNAWRAAHFGGIGATTNSQSCATCDADHDGLNNRQEFFAGTDPTNANSTLRLAGPVVNGTNVTVSFSSVQGIVYRVQAKDDLTNTNWSILADQVIGPGGLFQITDPGAANLPKRFYRVQVFPQ